MINTEYMSLKQLEETAIKCIEQIYHIGISALQNKDDTKPIDNALQNIGARVDV